MRGWLPDWSSLSGSLWRMRWLIMALLAIDLALLATFLRWAYVAHHGIRDSVFHGDLRFSTVDGSVLESWGYAKQLVALLFLAWTAAARRSRLLAAVALLATAILLDDALQLHERLGLALRAGAQPWIASPAAAQFAGKLLVSGLPALIVVICYLASRPGEKPLAHLLLAPLVLLAGFSVGVDFLHDLRLWRGGETLSSLIEDGGELLSMSALLVAALLGAALTRAPPPGAPAGNTVRPRPRM